MDYITQLKRFFVDYKYAIILVSIIFIGFVSFGVFFSPGTRGLLKQYNYYGSTYLELRKATETVIKQNSNIIQEETSVEASDEVTIKIKSQSEENEYTFHYFGNAISLIYARDKNRNGGSEGMGSFDGNLKEELFGVFEVELIDKIDEVLHQKRTED